MDKQDFEAGKIFKVNKSKLFSKKYKYYEGCLQTVSGAKNDTMFKANIIEITDKGFKADTQWKGAPLQAFISYKDCELLYKYY